MSLLFFSSSLRGDWDPEAQRGEFESGQLGSIAYKPLHSVNHPTRLEYLDKPKKKAGEKITSKKRLKLIFFFSHPTASGIDSSVFLFFFFSLEKSVLLKIPACLLFYYKSPLKYRKIWKIPLPAAHKIEWVVSNRRAGKPTKTEEIHELVEALQDKGWKFRSSRWQSLS